MENSCKSMLACLFTLMVNGQALAEDRGTNAIPTALLERYIFAGDKPVMTAERGTNAIPTALLELYTGASTAAGANAANHVSPSPVDMIVGSTTPRQ
jgi:hypothetical protein